MDNTYAKTIPNNTGPFKIYGIDTQSDRPYFNKLGWYYPLYTTEADAIADDTANGGSGQAHTHKFKNISQVFYMPNYSSSHATNNTDSFVEYIATKPIIQGHDGSKYVGFKDIRDNVILELEKRIYNNIKSFYSSNLFDVSNVQPGYFRNTQQEFAEISIILRKYFGEWAVRNKVDQDKNDTYDATNSFTWNYNNSVLKTDSSLVPGYWRGIYKWLYDTDTPHTRPWEMLGISKSLVGGILDMELHLILVETQFFGKTYAMVKYIMMQ